MAEKSGITIINSHIESGDYAGIYLLCGEEKYLVKQYKDKLVSSLIDVKDTMNFSLYKGDNAKVEQIADSALTMPFFSDRRVVLVEDSEFFKKGSEELEKLMSELPDTTVLIFVETNIDKRNKLYKTVSTKGTVASFDTPDEKTLLIWLKSLFTKEGINASDSAIYYLLESVGMDMNNLFNEVEKLKSYCIEKKVVSKEDVETLCTNQVEGKIFDMMDALSKRDKKTTMDLYNDLILLREPAMRILFLITRQFNILLKIKLALQTESDSGRIAQAVKVPPFTVKKYIAQCKGYTYQELLDRVSWCQKADTDIKSGAMKDGLAVEMLIFNLLQ